MKRPLSGFTLIELLIVVAIIAILAAIAVPNFLEAQTRAKVVRAKADMRTIGVAIETYAVDNHKTPYAVIPTYIPPERENLGYVPSILSTPIAYITSIPTDPFTNYVRQGPTGAPFGAATPGSIYTRFLYSTKRHWDGFNPSYSAATWENGYNSLMRAIGVSEHIPYIMTSPGPDNTQNVLPSYSPAIYDPTNGTVSAGDVTYLGSVGSTK